MAVGEGSMARAGRAADAGTERTEADRAEEKKEAVKKTAPRKRAAAKPVPKSETAGLAGNESVQVGEAMPIYYY